MIKKGLKNYIMGLTLLFILFVVDQAAIIFLGSHGDILGQFSIILKITSLILMGMAVYFTYFIYNKTLNKNSLKINNQTFNWKKALFIVLALVASYVLMNLAQTLLHIEHTGNQSMLNSAFKKNKIYIFIMIVFYAPIIEELMFRGVLFNFLLSKEFVNKNNEKIFQILCILISSFLFAFAHTMEFSKELAIYGSMGLVFSVSYLFTKDIKVNIGVHFLSNLIAGILMLIN